eukprot:CAMPEP_0184706174 /NCGR_PEP_ID=MMETSP0313-20130426/36625_1 /TAXON_ID=2792 /ORGANISM="Porphyridium aerugineum, Strain SAG 1380-2" /LENGTH=687 /DNA_ID=CAMNT_0027167721 /DNA_START=984 /DNA_END=3044 /DNA_ORIENTATION=-
MKTRQLSPLLGATLLICSLVLSIHATETLDMESERAAGFVDPTRLWVQEVLDRGSNDTVTTACCISPDTDAKQGISAIVVFGSSNGDIDNKGTPRTTYDLWTGRYDIQTGAQIAMLMIPALDASSGNETALFLITNREVLAGQIAGFGLTNGVFGLNPRNNAPVSNPQGYNNIIGVRINNGNTFFFSRMQVQRNRGNDELGAVSLVDNGYILYGAGRRSASDLFPNTLIILKLSFVFVQTFYDEIVKTREANGLLQIRTSWERNMYGVPGETNYTLLGYGITLVPNEANYYVEGFSKETFVSLFTQVIEYVNPFLGQMVPIEINSIFHDPTIDLIYVGGQFPPGQNPLYTKYSTYCSPDANPTQIVYGAIEGDNYNVTLPFQPVRASTVPANQNTCGFANLIIRDGESFNESTGQTDARVLFGMDAWVPNKVPPSFAFVYQTSVAPGPFIDPTSARLREVQYTQEFVSMETIQTSAVQYGNVYRDINNNKPCFPEGPDYKNITIANFAARAQVTTPTWYKVIGTACNDYVKQVSIVQQNYAVLMGITQGSFVPGGTNPQKRDRVVLFSFEPNNGTFPRFSFSCEKNPICTPGPTSTPTPSPSPDVDCILNDTYCTCAIQSFENCVSPHVEKVNTCVVGECLGLACTCAGEHLCRFHVRTEFTADEIITNQDEVACSLFTTTYPMVLW